MTNTRLSDRAKRIFLMVADAITLPLALWAAVILRYGDVYIDMMTFWWLFPMASVLGVASFARLDLYRAIIRYIGPSAMLPVIQGVTIAAVGVSLTAYATGAVTFPRSAPIIFWFVATLMIGGGRIVVRAYFYGLFKNYLTREAVAIYGAGDSGAQLAVALLNDDEFNPVAFVDSQVPQGVGEFVGQDFQVPERVLLRLFAGGVHRYQSQLGSIFSPPVNHIEAEVIELRHIQRCVAVGFFIVLHGRIC